MNKQPLRLRIPETCVQQTGEMEKRQNGHYCGSCARLVTDFTQMSDEQVFSHVRQNGLGCGTFRADQLNRSVLPRGRRERKGIARWMFSLTCLLLWIQDSSAQSAPGKPRTVQAPVDPAASKDSMIVTYHQYRVPLIRTPREPGGNTRTGAYEIDMMPVADVQPPKKQKSSWRRLFSRRKD